MRYTFVNTKKTLSSAALRAGIEHKRDIRYKGIDVKKGGYENPLADLLNVINLS